MRAPPTPTTFLAPILGKQTTIPSEKNMSKLPRKETLRKTTLLRNSRRSHAHTSAAKQLLGSLRNRPKHIISVEHFLATSESLAKAGEDLKRFCNEVVHCASPFEGDCFRLCVQRDLRSGTQDNQQWTIVKPNMLSPKPKKDRDNLNFTPLEYFESLQVKCIIRDTFPFLSFANIRIEQSIVEVGAMQERAPVPERKQKLIARLLDGTREPSLRRKAVGWCNKIYPVLPNLASILVTIEYDEIESGSPKPERVKNHFKSFFGCSLSPDEIINNAEVKDAEGELDANAILEYLQKLRSQHLESCLIQGSSESYKIWEPKIATVLS